MKAPSVSIPNQNAAGLSAVARRRLQAVTYPLAGIAIMFLCWWLGGWVLAGNPDTVIFAGFAPGPTLASLQQMLGEGALWDAIGASLYRIGAGLFWGCLLGIPLGIMVGYFTTAMQMANLPFQFLRMVSPLAWMPLAVMIFDSWDGAIVFLIAMAALWPILFSTAHGVRRIDPGWLKVARNLGAGGAQMLRKVILPAVMMDMMAGIRLAVGVAWVVLVPAEYLGVTSGLGYAINDARDTLDYSALAAVVLVIGVIGYGLDSLCGLLMRRFNWRMES
ncbi:binding-protein dependent transport system inner membrane protein [Alcanivorax balearicus MACL04]|uniref:Binding-protein dependent transport system inner membrane protein n=1 Tax=Alloalcanivorax balearicus MACL04 TaxID=1177182 RepID=A0ABT2R2E8_9GAMM|nr:ABC transporter permease [Alloalcanivorax balearicus]MCU5783919.1 binding-protein dependent transport system inner membrane protein [Alloalcanivorax balearicus MACL04]